MTIGYGVIGTEQPWVTNAMKHVAEKYNLEYGVDIKLQYNGSEPLEY